ncbi:MAG: hypothetical protein NVS1B4_26350 [Gemmatimonadaceae bacterium]
MSLDMGSIFLWGFVATLVLATIESAAQGLGLSRMSTPFLLGTMVTGNRDRAGVIGYVMHFAIGWCVAVVYALIFQSWHRATWWLGAALGLGHGLAVLLVVMPLLPGVHPRMASEHRGPEPTRALEPPGFMALHYGRRTPQIALLAHVMYGGIIGAFYRLAGS